MTIDDNIRNEILQYNINREAAKISVLSSGRIDGWIWISYRWENISIWSKQNTEQARFTCFSLGKALEKQAKTIEVQRKKLINALKVLKYGQKLTIKNQIPEKQLSEEAKNKIKEKAIEKTLNRENVLYACIKDIYNLRKFDTIRSLAAKNYNEENWLRRG